MKILQFFGFREEFISVIEMLYNRIHSFILLVLGTGSRFEVKRIHCSSSPLFITDAELLF